MERDVGPLLHAARAEGFGFLDRLLGEWLSGANRFDREGERLVAVRQAESLVAIGGLNRDLHAGPRTGRLRRVYVAPDQRRHGIGRTLVERLLARAPAAFDRVRLRTDDEGAARFYEALGFGACDEPDASHVLALAPAARGGATTPFGSAGGCGP